LGDQPFTTPNTTASTSPHPVVQPNASAKKKSLVNTRFGFLGSTSFDSVFAEDRARTGIADADVDAETETLPPLNPDDVQRGAEILAVLKDLPLFDRFIERWYRICESLIVLKDFAQTWAAELWKAHKEVLLSQDASRLLQLSEKVWRNSQQPLQFDGSTTAREWTLLSTGVNLRWEVVGLLCCCVGLTSTCLSSQDSLFFPEGREPIDRVFLWQQMHTISTACWNFVCEIGLVNDMYQWLCHESCTLASSTKDAASFSTWQRCGEVISSALALGLHGKIQASASIPFFLAELRKRAFAAAYGDDKVVSIFLGRPPRLSHRYCIIQAPLDLSKDELLSEGADLQSALDGLDADGWNRAGLLRRCGWLRVALRVNIIKEDILELSLGNHSQEETSVFAEAIISKLRKQYVDRPPHYRPAYDTDWAAERNPLGALLLICSRMTYEMNQLLIQMVLIKKTGADTGELIACARRMFKDVLQFATRRDITKDFQADHSWIMGTNGLRSASILAVELLKQEQLPGYLSSNPVPRSETIKDLSVFCACLASVDPNDGCWTVCNHGRKILDTILDKILTPAPARPDASVVGVGQVPALTPADSAGGMGIDLNAPFPFDSDADFVRWLEDMEWEKSGNWTNLA